MKLELALSIIRKNKLYKDLARQTADGERAVVSVGSDARSYLIAALQADVGRPMLVITPNLERARRVVADLKAYSARAEFLPEVETMPYDSLSPSPAAVGQRLAVLDEMASGVNCTWVMSAQTALRLIPPATSGIQKPLSLAVGNEIDLYEFASRLTAMGYARVPLVEDNGQFSLRGGIIDIFASQAAVPVRVELFGDEVDSIRPFSVSTQRSTGQFKEVKIYGCRQVVLTQENVTRATSMIPENLPEWLAEEVGKLKDMQYFEGTDKYLPFLYEPAMILDYLPNEAIVVIDEPEEALQLAEQHLNQQLSYIDHLVEHQAIVNPPRSYFVEPVQVLSCADLELTSIGATSSRFSFKTSRAQFQVGGAERLKDVIQGYQSRGLKVVVTHTDESQLERTAKILAKEAIAHTRDLGNSKYVSLAIGDLSGGFASPDIGLGVVSLADIFGKRNACTKKVATEKGASISNIADLKIGDYVVHNTHGISVYGGLQHREVAGVTRDYALLEYAGSDRLFVPIEQLDRITKYIGAAGETPPVSRLGGSEWLKAKKKAKASVKKVAFDLLSMYASRAKAQGIAFSPDTPWQKELEDSFAYEETPDQLTAIVDVKRDMEHRRPMDRLICGDVGYGKTEVAVRAAFKAVAHGKQVMVLVPTTILAQQHYMTFSQRLASFPVTVDMASRFRSPAEQKETIAKFNAGKVDILIGTHRLLQSDVKPLEMGLVIIDEEQRFGVNDKEKLRNYKQSVDVLTLSATPIPRTLQMSIAGVRDMSVIETPPEGRHPVITHVGRYDEEMLVQAIRRELGRGGQVYYVHNRVETIDRVAGRIRELIPEAKVAVGHGQMGEHQLEKIMMSFLSGGHNVLVCTTIIESGIDIPTVNTLIVDRAEILGLAQLYQLRGRVGRTNQRAYAYFFFSPQRLLTTQAFERLKTINDYTELGSGMKVALRDLEIRGAGNLLGAEQHGYMSSVGFELYCQMLKEAIDEFEGKPVQELVDIKIDLPVSAYLPDDYIVEENLRIELYKKIVIAQELTDIDQIALELADRFGVQPEPVNRLLEIARLRVVSRKLGITEIGYQNGRVRVSPIQLARQQESTLTRRFRNLVVNQQRQYLSATKLEPDKIITFLLNLFDDIMIALTTGVMTSQKAIGRKAR